MELSLASMKEQGSSKDSMISMMTKEISVYKGRDEILVKLGEENCGTRQHSQRQSFSQPTANSWGKVIYLLHSLRYLLWSTELGIPCLTMAPSVQQFLMLLRSHYVCIYICTYILYIYVVGELIVIHAECTLHQTRLHNLIVLSLSFGMAYG